jgi:hypothetical protein
LREIPTVIILNEREGAEAIVFRLKQPVGVVEWLTAGVGQHGRDERK